MSINIENIDDEHDQRQDFRRANGAPLVSDPEDASKSLRYRRPSSYAKCLDDESALEMWKQWKVMQGVARSPALQAKVSALQEQDKEGKKVLREEAMQQGSANEAADLGTALHAMTARFEDVNDTDFDPPEQYRGDLDAYFDTLQGYGLVSEMVEVHMVNDEFRAAGTADRVFRTLYDLEAPDGSIVEAGELILGDIKTGKKLDFSLPGYCVQMAVYATGQLYDIHTERRLPTPPINNRWTLLIHLPVGRGDCKLLWCSINIGLHGAWMAQEIHNWRNGWKSGKDYEHDAIEVERPQLVMPAVVRVTEAFAETVEVGPVEVLKLRIKQIGDNPDARKALMLAWPEGLPSPKQGWSDEHVPTVEKLISQIEARFSVPF